MKKIFLILCFLIISITIYFAPKLIKQEEAKAYELTSTQQDLQKYLEESEKASWKQLNNIGITQTACNQLKSETYTQYKNEVSKAFVKNPDAKVASPTEKFIKGILKDFSIDENSIMIVPISTTVGAAQSCDHLLFINEEVFNTFSEPARKFIIGHEAQHILNKDHSTKSIIRNLLPEDEQKARNLGHDHPVMTYSRFTEERADILTALKSEEWAQYYLIFTQECIEKDSEVDYPTHPAHSKRLALAQNITQNNVTTV